MKKKVIYKDGRLIEIKKVYLLFDDEGNVIRRSNSYFPFSVAKKEQTIILDIDEIEDALL